MTPRGIRNNNPGNIRLSDDKWQGLDIPADDGAFFRFRTPAYGIRALARILITYQDKHGINTVRDMIGRYAPPAENETESYVLHAADHVSVSPDAAIDVHLYRHMRPLVEAIIAHENGVMPYTDAQIDKGLALAGVEPDTKPMAKSRTVKGGQVAVGGGAAVATFMQFADQVRDRAPMVSSIADAVREYGVWLVLVPVLIGVGYMLYARWDDRRTLAR